MHVLKVDNRVVGRYGEFEHACFMAVRRVLRTGDTVTVWRAKRGVDPTIVYSVSYKDGKLVDFFPEAEEV